MEIFEKINSLEILSILDAGNIPYKKDSGSPHMYTILKDDGKINSSFKVNTSKNIAVDFGGDGIRGGPFDIIGRLILGVDTQDNAGKVEVIKWAVDKGLVENPQTTKNFVKSLSGQELLDKFDDHRLGGYKTEISRFLLTRGFDYDWIQKNQLKVGEIFKDIGFYGNYFTTEFETFKDNNGVWQNREGDNPKTVAVFMFPCYDEQGTLIGLKLRRVDGKLIRGKKSLAIGNTGLLYDNVDLSSMVLVEGEIDYIILKLLGYTNVVGNLGGVQAHRQKLKSLLSETSKIICLYDNDDAGKLGKLALQETFKRPIYEITYPIRENTNGKALSDVGDYFEVGYDTKKKWDEILKTQKKLGEIELDDYNQEFVFLRKSLEYYDIKYSKIQQTGPTAAYMGITPKELAGMVKNGQVRTYKDLCYREGGKEGYYNTLDETTIIKHGGDAEAKLHPHIKYLVDNICGYKDCNIEWLHKSILYKLTHINDPYVPALILYGFGASGKGSLLNLLSKIFGEVNMQTGLGQKDLEGSFDSYQGEKLIVEFKEVSSGSRFQDKKVLDRIKSIISEKTITVNAKFQNVRQVESIARFHFSSNHSLPLQLDSKHSGNRRFTVIKTAGALDTEVAREMNEVTFENKQIIREYVAWLYETYPDVVKMTTFKALDNREKRELENSCEEIGNVFFEWFEEKYPHITKITNPERKKLVRMYCQESGEDPDDKKFNQSNFDLGLSHRYEKKKLKIRGTTPRGYYINKTQFELNVIPESLPREFAEGEVTNLLI